MISFRPELVRRQTIVERYLEELFVEKSNYCILQEAMRYSLLAGGKRLRPVLVMSFSEAVGGPVDEVLPAACAIELVHTYSLIHDDLPCMDNDDYRRGKLTCHKAYGEDIATLAGDALQAAAFRLLAEQPGDPAKILRCVHILAQGAGEDGMVAGQILDLRGEKQMLDETELREVHAHKTGDLIRAACQMGAVLGGGSESQIQAAGEYAMALGMAFQIRDDMLDVIGDAEKLGKAAGMDAQKSTFVRLYGMDACEALILEKTEQAAAALEPFAEPDFLRELAFRLVRRDH